MKSTIRQEESVGKFIDLTAKDGHSFGAYVAEPSGKPRGGLVVIQEIFGVNEHIRWVADGYAADGYYAVAPAMFDRSERGVEIGYEPADRDKGLALRKSLSDDEVLLDIGAAVEAAKSAGKVGIVGYCFGGSMAWLSAARVPGLAAAVGYYGGQIASLLEEKPQCPVMLHFGETDPTIPVADAEKVKATLEPAGIPVFIYPVAGHAFNRYGNQAWHEESAKLARERTLQFLQDNVG
jgi:carboxymethylenebutenolidase